MGPRTAASGRRRPRCPSPLRKTTALIVQHGAKEGKEESKKKGKTSGKNNSTETDLPRWQPASPAAAAGLQRVSSQLQ